MKRTILALQLLVGLIVTIPYLAWAGAAPIYFVHSDHLGTPQKLTDDTGQIVWEAAYDPFGNATIDEDPDGDFNHIEFNLRFPGQHYDQYTGKNYNYYRDYDPSTGRYIQSDPIGLQGGLNTYSYVWNNPQRYTDPTGESGLAGAGYGFIAGGIGGYISGGGAGAVAGAVAGAAVGFFNPLASNAAGAAAGAGAASLLGQGVGNLVAGKDALEPCNYDYSAAAGAMLGGLLGGPLNSAIARYAPPIRFPVIGRSPNAPGISNTPGRTAGAVAEGISVGAGELGGQKL